MECSITMTQADKVLAAAQSEAARLGSRINAIAVVDTHGELVVFARMDDATIHSIAFAQQKARSAAARAGLGDTASRDGRGIDVHARLRRNAGRRADRAQWQRPSAPSESAAVTI